MKETQYLFHVESTADENSLMVGAQECSAMGGGAGYCILLTSRDVSNHISTSMRF